MKRACPWARSKSAADVSEAVRPALQKRGREKRDLLIKAGLRAFARDGYNGAKIADIADIAEDAGISVGVFYQRFKDQRGFFSALETRFMEGGTDNWDRFCDESAPKWSARELLTRMVSNMGSVIVHNEAFFRALVTLGHQDKSVIPPGIDMDRHGADRVAELLLARGFIDPRDIDREQVFFGISSITQAMIMMTITAGGGYRVTDDFTVEHLTSMLASYLGIRI